MGKLVYVNKSICSYVLRLILRTERGVRYSLNAAYLERWKLPKKICQAFPYNDSVSISI